MALNYVTVTGTFDDGSGNPIPATGQVAYCLFTPSTPVYASGVPLITPAQAIQAPIINGALSQRLLATDNSGLTFGGLTGFFYWTVQLVIAGQASPSWSFFLPHLPSSVDLSALANTAAGGGGTSLPLTTLGDILYENATPAPARLPGNATAAKQFLTQTGTGSVSAAPAWAAIQAADVPGFDGVTVTGTPSSGMVPTATGGSAATWQTPSAGFQAWQFLPETYGAKGDGKVIADAVLSSNTTLTSATANFTSGDTGKTIMVNGGLGGTSVPLVTTITFVNSTTVTLGSAAGVSGSAFQAVYGTDDTAAINSAVSAAGTYALANDYFAEVVFGAKIYMLASGPTQSGNGSTTPTFNAQIPLPFPAANGTSRKLVITLRGAGEAGHVQYWESITPNVAGTALVSTLTSAPSSPDATFGNQSVIGGPSGSAGFTGGYANTKVSVTGIQVWSAPYTNQYAFDFAYLGGIYIRQAAAHIFAPSGVNGGNSPLLKDLPAQAGFQNKIGCGLRAPVTGNNADCVVDSLTVEGYSRAVYVFDHFCATRLFTFYNDVALKVDSSQGISGVEHLISIANFGCEAYNGGISTTGSGGPFIPVAINMDAEVASPVYDINDGGNILHGWISWDDTTRTAPTVTGAGKVKITNASMGPGNWASPPAVPASTVAQQNTSWRDAAVSIKGGTVTVIAVDGATLATATGTTVIVPAGKNITLTYSVAPTWAWTLL